MRIRPRTLTLLMLVAAAMGQASTVALALETAQSGECGKKIEANGFVRPSTGLAELSAIQNWLETVARQDAGRAVWHRAQEQILHCATIGNIGSVRCTAAARPCALPAAPDATADTAR